MKTIREQIASVEREISFRKRCYPRWISEKKITQKNADYEIRCMECVRESLILMPKDAALIKL